MKLKSKEEYGAPTIEFGKNDAHFISLINDWEQLFGQWNWYNLTLVEISLERDLMVPGYEIVICLLGIGIRLRINQDLSSTEQGKELESRIKESELELNKKQVEANRIAMEQQEQDGTL